MLKLEDFVSETLKQIINGVKSAQDHAKECGGEVNPKGLAFYLRDGQQTAVIYDSESGRPIEKIDFDVAVSASSGEATKGGVGVFVFGVGAGVKGSSDSKTESMNRISFSVPVSFPVQP